MKHSSPSTRDVTCEKMYLIDLTATVSHCSSLDEVLNETEGLWQSLYDEMSPAETLWVIAPNEYRDGRMWPIAMATADYAREETNLVLKNTISVHRWDDRGADMESSYDEILFFIKDKRKYRFEKDRIRIEHVYQGHEWGGKREKGNSAYHDREVSRYNENGKDPGNVWLEEIRTQTDNQEVDETGPIQMEEAIRRCILVGSDEGETVSVLGSGDRFEGTIENENRIVESFGIETFREEVVN
ncbi:DNA methyltransferase [Halorubrum laminariae]|uniref:DNA methyltransferase n=1 Tax=Halorubrum laminariae TaxID=1433523 RepID=A0ABD6C0G1_9EURY|nr:DNA methyltransferase [Halorubrum laminariae]